MAGGEIQEGAAGSEGQEATAPLLEKEKAAAVYVEGCPGCASDRRKAANPGIPYLQFFHVWSIILVSCLPISFIYPFLYFMIRDLHVAKTVEDIGFYGGFVGASYMLGRALTSTVWGMVADRIGRKPVIVFGIFSMLVFNTLFGLSTNYWMAITSRFLVGSLTALLGPIRAYTNEICRPEHQAIGMSLYIMGSRSYYWTSYWRLSCTAGRKISNVISRELTIRKETLHNHKLDKIEDRANGSFIAHSASSEELIEQQVKSVPTKNLLKNWPLMSSIVLYCIFCFDDMAYTEIVSLWSESDRKYGGLSFSPQDVGQVFAITGGSVVLYQTFIYPQIDKILGPINTSRVATVVSMVLLFTYPPMTHLSRPWLPIILNIVSVLKANCLVSIVTCCFILQNNSVNQDQRATADGLATTIMSVFKACAPAGAGIVFSWAQRRQHAFFFPGDQILFFLLVVVEFLGLVWTFKPFLAIPEKFPQN
ncbi:protein ZINC INDUCED FACILITATOR-LIKE 1-like isoform X2 [Hordeum vulgare subsp. vulgare]|uniref:protein ZINC INDUCED FACILITATOR-LIKE 1-like isoform X2 n=1 Tax=Hordeum vulgare subsp. vulgare TaxID=112509 RepID=UPI001D1A3881|nr:protein ZINC INDUCED FACILITATOR-LIKE 1-like isoform X2 [Hordeum vulgare subsp. vulgare]